MNGHRGSPNVSLDTRDFGRTSDESPLSSRQINDAEYDRARDSEPLSQENRMESLVGGTGPIESDRRAESLARVLKSVSWRSAPSQDSRSSLWNSIPSLVEGSSNSSPSSAASAMRDSLRDPALKEKLAVFGLGVFSTENDHKHEDHEYLGSPQASAMQQIGDLNNPSGPYNGLSQEKLNTTIGDPSSFAESGYSGRIEDASAVFLANSNSTRGEIPTPPLHVTGYSHPSMNAEDVGSIEARIHDLVPSLSLEHGIRSNCDTNPNLRAESLGINSPTVNPDVGKSGLSQVASDPFHQDNPLLSGGLIENVNSPRPGDVGSDFSPAWMSALPANHPSLSSFGSVPGESKINGGDPSNDLTKTNELLQQLIDEVRKGRQGYLPIRTLNDSYY